MSDKKYKYCSVCLFIILICITIIGVLISSRTKETFEAFQNTTPYIQTQYSPSGSTVCHTGFRT